MRPGCRRDELALPPFYVLADADLLARRARTLGLNVPIARRRAGGGRRRPSRARCPWSRSAERVTAEPGTPDASSAPAAIASIRRAVADVFAGRAHAVVTNPVAKAVLYRTGFAEPGHTEFLARLAQEHTGRAAHPVMMLWSPELAVVPVTIHLPVRDVPQRLTADLIVETGRIVARDLRERFGIARPRLALAGLNPHAGEDGALGDEDRRRGRARGRAAARAKASTRADRCRPTPCSTRRRGAATTPRSRCITIRR